MRVNSTAPTEFIFSIIFGYLFFFLPSMRFRYLQCLKADLAANAIEQDTHTRAHSGTPSLESSGVDIQIACRPFSLLFFSFRTFSLRQHYRKPSTSCLASWLAGWLAVHISERDPSHLVQPLSLGVGCWLGARLSVLVAG